jgi:hypothetical protein
MQSSRTRLTEHTVPQTGTYTDHAREPSLGNAKADRSREPTDIGEQLAQRVFGPGVDGRDKEDR